MTDSFWGGAPLVFGTHLAHPRREAWDDDLGLVDRI